MRHITLIIITVLFGFALYGCGGGVTVSTHGTSEPTATQMASWPSKWRQVMADFKGSGINREQVYAIMGTPTNSTVDHASWDAPFNTSYDVWFTSTGSVQQYTFMYLDATGQRVTGGSVDDYNASVSTIGQTAAVYDPPPQLSDPKTYGGKTTSTQSAFSQMQSDQKTHDQWIQDQVNSAKK